jgi:hypothetical protein
LPIGGEDGVQSALTVGVPGFDAHGLGPLPAQLSRVCSRHRIPARDGPQASVTVRSTHALYRRVACEFFSVGRTRSRDDEARSGSASGETCSTPGSGLARRSAPSAATGSSPGPTSTAGGATWPPSRPSRSRPRSSRSGSSPTRPGQLAAGRVAHGKPPDQSPGGRVTGGHQFGLGGGGP